MRGISSQYLADIVCLFPYFPSDQRYLHSNRNSMCSWRTSAANLNGFKMIENDSVLPVSQPPILSYLKNIPNLCSLAGLACTLLAICHSIWGNYPVAMIAMVWAVAFDWADGLFARRMQGRTGNDRAFGGQLDVLIDIVSYGVTPAILLMSYGDFEPIFITGGFIMLSTSALRLSYFSTYGLSDENGEKRQESRQADL